MLKVVRTELRTHAGPVTFDDTSLGQWAINRHPIRGMHADWPLIAMSILYADHGQVRTILLPGRGEFEPFNPYSEATLPHLAAYGIDYRPYLAALSGHAPEYRVGDWISFNARPDEAGARRIGEWWAPEPWGTWIGSDASLAINLADPVTSDLVLEAQAGALVNAKNPQISVQVRVNEIPAGVWSFQYKPGAIPYQAYRMALSHEALAKSNPVIIRFVVTGARTPMELAMGNDPRRLGMAIVRLRLAEDH
jgi:hypothetical protein